MPKTYKHCKDCGKELSIKHESNLCPNCDLKSTISFYGFLNILFIFISSVITTLIVAFSISSLPIFIVGSLNGLLFAIALYLTYKKQLLEVALNA
jgi:RNA polymerase subunit RPABC4/transcription elongation factor Spt4